MSNRKNIDDTKNLPLQKLLSCFFSECEKQFGFLEGKHGFSSYSGLVDYQRGRHIIRPYNGQEIEGVFWATARYEKNDQSFEISFGDSNLSLKSHICYDRINRLAFGELLQALKIRDREDISGPWVQKEEELNEMIGKMSGIFKKNLSNILEPDQKTMDKAIVIHMNRLRQKVMDDHKKNIKEVSLKAAKAFCDKDYRRVIELLTPYKDYIARYDKKKLEISQKVIAPLEPPCWSTTLN